MTTTLSEAQYVEEALAAMKLVENETELVAWDEAFCGSSETYLHLSERDIRKLEEAYQRKLAWFCGVGAG